MKHIATIFALLLSGAVLAQAPSSYELPDDEVFPEGIAASADAFWVGSAVDGTIYRGDLATGDVEAFTQVPPLDAAGTPESAPPGAFGMALDAEGVLWVAGGDSGNLYRFDAASGELTGTFTTPPSGNIFLNDVALGLDGSVYVTDSFRPILFRIPPAAGPGPMDAWLSFEDAPISYQDGFNLNGIVATDDGRYLLTIQTNTGDLFRVDIAERAIARVDVDADLTAGDGLVLDGRTLYVVRNRANEIVPIDLAEDFASGTAGTPIRSATFDFPTTAALVDGSLLVVNSQLPDPGTGQADTPFTVERVPLE